MTIENLVEVAKYFKKATNVHSNGYGFYEEMEKHLRTEINQGRV